MSKKRRAKQGTAVAAQYVNNDVQAAIARTRELDRLDVMSGKRRAESLHFISSEMARNSKQVFPKKYRKS
jgi:hypothetical protein